MEELLHAINVLGDDRDVTVDGIDSIAVCPPVKLTPEGRKHFQQALTANVNVESIMMIAIGAPTLVTLTRR